MILSRRGFLAGLIAAPIIVRPGILMPVKPLVINPVDPVAVLDELWSRVRITGQDAHGQYVVETIEVAFERSMGDVAVTGKAFVYVDKVEFI